MDGWSSPSALSPHCLLDTSLTPAATYLHAGKWRGGEEEEGREGREEEREAGRKISDVHCQLPTVGKPTGRFMVILFPYLGKEISPKQHWLCTAFQKRKDYAWPVCLCPRKQSYFIEKDQQDLCLILQNPQ